MAGDGQWRTVTAVALAAGALLLQSATGAGATGDEPPVSKRELRAVADDVRDATNAPGAIVAVQQGRKPPVIVTRGTRDRRGGGAIETDDAFVIMSVSKAFTAAVVLALVDRGDLALDDRVARSVPGWDRRITVRQLLNHTSGLPSWGNKDDPPDSPREALENADLSRRFTMEEGLAPVKAMPLLAPPGRRTHYTNANTILAGLAPGAGMVSNAPDVLGLARAFLRGTFPDRAVSRVAKRISRGGAGLGIIGFTRRGYCIFDGCPPGRSFPRIGFAGNGPGVALRTVHDPRSDTTVLVFANSSQQGKLDPFVALLLDRFE